MNAEKAYKNFFNCKSKFPKFNKKNKSDVKMYFVNNSATEFIKCEGHRIKIPTLGFVQLKEKGYIPLELINKTPKVKKIEKKLKREQRRLPRKYESSKKRKNKNEKGEATRTNIEKQVVKVQKIHQKLNNIRTDYINKIVNDLVKTKLYYITIEDLNVSGMMKNRHLAKSVAQQKFYEFRVKLEQKCKQNGIELRIVDRFYPSSKLCHKCGNIKKDLKLSDRVYICECGYETDRD